MKPLQFYDAKSKQIEMIESKTEMSKKPQFKFKSNKEAYYLQRERTLGNNKLVRNLMEISRR